MHLRSPRLHPIEAVVAQLRDARLRLIRGLPLPEPETLDSLLDSAADLLDAATVDIQSVFIFETQVGERLSGPPPLPGPDLKQEKRLKELREEAGCLKGTG